MNLDEVKNNYISGSRKILDANEAISTGSYSLWDMLSKTKLNSHKLKLKDFYKLLHQYDDAYAESLYTKGTINELHVRQARIAIVSQTRNLFVSSLSNYERELSNIENNLNFRLTTTIAILAIIISIVA